jgi:hypothetical protein
MNIVQISEGCKTNWREWRRFALLMVAPFLILPSALGQGFKMTQLNVPGNITGTFPLGVNTSGAVVGEYTNSAGAVVGFLFTGGKYTNLVVPGSVNFTRANGINDSKMIVGDFFGSDNAYHGFTYVGGNYTQYDVDKGVVSTSIFGVNKAGDFVGIEGANGFINIAGTVTEFNGSGTDLTYATGSIVLMKWWGSISIRVTLLTDFSATPRAM